MLSTKLILHTAKNLIAKNLVFGLFGLALYGGFNLYLINFFALLNQDEWKAWPSAFESVFNGAMHGYVLLLFAGAVLFVTLNIVKILFIVYAHNEIHRVRDLQCDLCVRVVNESMPYAQWLKYVVLASSITVIITSSIALTTGTIISRYAFENTPVVVVNILFTTLVMCIAGIWNLFTSYFVVLHGMNFSRASKIALDLLVLRFRRVVEFMVILSILYSLAVMIGNAFIHVWQNGLLDSTEQPLRLIALVAFVVWFALNNVFFNLSFLIFFDELVKSIGSRAEAAEKIGFPEIVQ